jgi:hypothetical protein
MRAATGLVLLVAALLVLLRWNYNSTLEAETTLAHAKLHDANLKLQAELTTLKARMRKTLRSEEEFLQSEEFEIECNLQAVREQSRTQLAAASKAAAPSAAASTAAASTSPLEANLARSQAAASTAAASAAAASTVAASTIAASAAAGSTSPLEANLARNQAAASAAASASLRVAWVPANSSAAAAHAALESEPLLEVHRHWDWASIAKELLYPFEGIDKRMLREGVKSCFDNGTMCLPPPPSPPPPQNHTHTHDRPHPHPHPHTHPPTHSHPPAPPPRTHTRSLLGLLTYCSPTGHHGHHAWPGTVSAFKSRADGSTSPTTAPSSSIATTHPRASCRCSR